MAIVSISLPDSVKAFLDTRVAQGRFSDAGEYVTALIELDQARQATAESDPEALRQAVQLGLDDLDRGDYAEYDSAEQLASEIKAEGRRRLASQQSVKR